MITNKALDIVKSFNEDQRLFTCCVLRPNVVDIQGDIYDAETVEKAAYDFMEFCKQGNLFHALNTDKIVVVESWVAKSTYAYGNGEIKAGDWMMTLHILDDVVWGRVKSGDLTGLSVGCRGVIEEIVEGGSET